MLGPYCEDKAPFWIPALFPFSIGKALRWVDYK